MPLAFLNLTPELEAACSTSVVLTPTERLARNLLRAYNDQQLERGRQAWQTPRIHTFESYLGQALSRQQMNAGEPRLELLGSEAEYAVFHDAAPADGARLISFAREAWQLSHQWGITLEPENFAATENGRCFLDWARRVASAVRDRGATTRAELSTLADLRAPDPVIVCLDFENLPASYQGWLSRQQAAGTRVEFLTTPTLDAEVRCARFETPVAELAAVSQWAAQVLASQPDPRIGIVLPDLGSRYTAVLRALTAQLDPLLEHGTNGLIDLGGGLPLASQPVWQSAVSWLRLGVDELPVRDLAALVGSRYLGLPALTRPAHTLLPFVRLDDLPEFSRLTGVSRWPDRALLPEWIERFRERLYQAGWTADRAGSVQYQAWQDVNTSLEQLSRQPVGPMAADTALKMIDACLAGITFAPEAAAAPIQIMGYLETTGLHFSHLWVAGLDDESWPAPVRSNPFLPTAARLRHGVPRTTPDDEGTFARERLAHWRASAAQLVLSHARVDGESVRRPSPLIRSLPEASLDGLDPGRSHPFIAPARAIAAVRVIATGAPALEQIADLTGTPAEPGSRRGGTRLFRDQALCPFRGYAIHRLGLAEPREPHALPDPLDRGSLVHEALHRLYQPVQADRQRLAELDQTDFASAADAALTRLYGRFPAPFRQRERDRLIRLLAAWHRLDSQRDGFTIETLEGEQDADFDGIQLTLRIDRADRIGEALAVIDYKTGKVPAKLNESRLTEPQLPMYALSAERINAVLYAEVDEQQPRLTGTAAPDLDIPGARLAAPVADDWQRQREAWRAQIRTLSREIEQGWATVTPDSGAVCERCHLAGLCRIGDRRADTGDHDASGGRL